MKRIMLITLASLIALTSAARAQTGFDLNAMPLGEFPTTIDKARTGSIGTHVQKRIIIRDGASFTQFFTVDENGKMAIISEKAN
jgi:hypothetical protein